MDIQYLGHSSFYIKASSGSIITDPFNPEIVGLKYPKKEADIVTISHEHEDHNFISVINGEPFICRYPGEYEKGGIHITGYPSYHDNKGGAERGKNILFKIEIDKMTILHCGDLGYTLTNEAIEEIGDIDVLMIPVGGVYTIKSEQAVEIVQEIEPSYVIPMHFFHSGMNEKVFGELEKVDSFVQKMGIESVQKVKKLSLKKETQEDTCSVVLFEIE